MDDLPDTAYAGVDRRLGAYLLDVVLLYLVLVGWQYVLWRLTGFPFDRLTTGPLIEGWVLLTISLPTWLYFAWSESSGRAATLGKRLFGLKVVRRNGETVSFGRALARTLIKLLPWELTHLSLFLPTPIMTDPAPGLRAGLICVYPLVTLYLASMIFTRRKQSFHDLLLATVVLDLRRLGDTSNEI
jgi:uncharacterized RDD family membrane protein YckC